MYSSPFFRWLFGRTERGAARRALRELFRDPARLRGTSLRPEHAGRAQLLEFGMAGERVAWLEFGIVRHPRPYPFSRQVHEVIEYWRYDAVAGLVERLGGVNLSRQRGTDGDPGAP